MYHNNKAVLTFMVTAFVASITTSGYIIGRVLGDITGKLGTFFNFVDRLPHRLMSPTRLSPTGSNRSAYSHRQILLPHRRMG
jgi:hypothetical protein